MRAIPICDDFDTHTARQAAAESAGLVDTTAGMTAGLYEYVDEEQDLIQLTAAGVAAAEAAGLIIDVDAYGCAFVVGVETY